tara:strand:- start:18759 stop:20042 length:1284 start_codon:yes stop_codon:yes gene_type:complete
MKLNYSHPKIYTGGVDVAQWSKLSKQQQSEALEKDWYVYYSFRDPETGKLKRQQNIKAGANRYKDKRSRFSYLKTLETNLLHLLELGFNPYKDNTALENKHFGDKSKNKENKINKKNNSIVSSVDSVSSVVLFEKALEVGMLTKSKVLNENSYKKFKSRINRFNQWLKSKRLYATDINNINKAVVVEYLNEVLQTSSARNRNNTRTDLSSLFQTFVDNDFIEKNFIKDVSVLKSIPTRNKTYTLQQQQQLYVNMQQQDATLLLFVKFVSYNFLRPIEVCRLRVGDVDLVEKKLYVRAKNQPVKTKIIPEILINDLPDLSNVDKELFLFTPNGVGGNWEIDESNKRTYFTGRFKKIKDQLGLGKEYGLYSFRHTFITKLYREIAKDSTPFATKSKLMLITGHSSMTALEKYLRDIDAELPEDYSNYLK